MVKFRTFLKRSGVLICVLVIMLVCALPSSAASLTSTKVAPIMFDQIGFLYGEAFERSYRMPFPGNILGPSEPGSGYVQYKDENSTLNNSVYITGVSQLDNGLIRTNYRLSYDYTGWGVGLFNVSGNVLESALINDSSGYNVSFSLGTVGLSGRVSISLQAVKVVNSADAYYTTSKSFTLSNIPFGENGVDLFDLIDQAITDFTFRDGEYLYLPLLNVRFFFDDMNLDELAMHIETTNRNVPNSYSMWFNQFDLPRSVVVNPVDPDGVDLVDWLSVAVGGFLDFELWPGMSLNELLWACLVIGVLFVFLRMAAG